MAEEMKKEMNADEFKGLSMRVLPHLLTLLQTAQDVNRDCYITVDADGYISFRTNASDWQLTRYTDGRTYVEHSYRDRIKIEEDEAC